MSPANDVPAESAWSLATLDRSAHRITLGLAALGMISGARMLLALVDQPGLGFSAWAATLMGALYQVGAHGLAGVALGALLRLLGRCLSPRERAVEWESQPGVEAAGAAAIAAPGAPPAPSPGPGGAVLDLLREQALAQIRKSVRSGNWDEARSLLDSFARDYQGDPRISSLDQEFQAARNAARDEHMAQLDAVRKVNDPDRVLELHKFLVPLLEAEARASLEADLSRWFLWLIHNRLRTGRIQADLAHLAGRIAESFSHTVEGASLHASLPTLRRSAGLCPRCAQPYTGVADACPDCLGLGQAFEQATDLPDHLIRPPRG